MIKAAVMIPGMIAGRNRTLVFGMAIYIHVKTKVMTRNWKKFRKPWR